MADDTDLHVGKRLRRRRRLLGMTQQDLASQVGVRFQQIQKYECGANRITASRLYELAKAMSVSVQYFFDGIPAANAPDAANDADGQGGADALVVAAGYCFSDVRCVHAAGRPKRGGVGVGGRRMGGAG